MKLRMAMCARALRVVRRFASPGALRLLREYRAVPAPGRRFYLGAYWRALWRRRNLPDRVQCVLFVCHGNIIRSPLAAALLEQRLPAPAAVHSAGVRATPGKPADRRAVLTAARFGVSLERHTAQHLNDALVRRADVIFVMDGYNEALVVSRYPEAREKVRRLGAFVTSCRLPRGDITDPFAGDADQIYRCYALIDEAVGNLARRLAAGPATPGK